MPRYSVKEFLAGDQKAWLDLHDKIPNIVAYLRKKYDNGIDAENLAAQAWTELYEKVVQKRLPDGIRDFYAFFRGVVDNKVKEDFREKKSAEAAMKKLVHEMEPHVRPNLALDDEEAFQEAVEKVVQPGEEPLLTYWLLRTSPQRISLKDVAAKLGCSEETARKRLRQLLARLGQYVKSQRLDD